MIGIGSSGGSGGGAHRDLVCARASLPRQERTVGIIELPSVKDGSPYAEGLEHCEFVIDVDFATFIARYPTIHFDLRALHKESNPDIAVKLPSGHSVKFHHQPLDVVVEQELAAEAKQQQQQQQQ